MVYTYYMHTKELHAVFQNHASYQASWISTSTACNSYPHIIHVNIFNMHIPTSFSQKKTTCYLNEEINMQNDFFFPVFQLRKKKKHAYTNIILTKKLHVIQTKKLTCKLDFFSSFPAQKKKQHAYTNIILTKKLHVIRTKKSTCKLDFFLFQFSSSKKKKKTACIYQHYSHKKTACYSNQEINMQTGFFSFPVFLLRKKNSMHIPTSFSQKNCMLFKSRN